MIKIEEDSHNAISDFDLNPVLKKKLIKALIESVEKTGMWTVDSIKVLIDTYLPSVGKCSVVTYKDTNDP